MHILGINISLISEQDQQKHTKQIKHGRQVPHHPSESTNIFSSQSATCQDHHPTDRSEGDNGTSKLNSMHYSFNNPYAASNH